MEEIEEKKETTEQTTPPSFKGYENFGSLCLVIGVIALIVAIITLINSSIDYEMQVGALISGFFVFCFMGGVLKILVQIEKNTRK